MLSGDRPDRFVNRRFEKLCNSGWEDYTLLERRVDGRFHVGFHGKIKRRRF